MKHATRFFFSFLMIPLLRLQAGSTWDGEGPGNAWSTGANWNDDAAPASDGTAAIVFPVNTRTKPAGPVVNVDAPREISSLTLNEAFTFTNAPLTLRSGALTASNGTISNDVVLGTHAVWNTGTAYPATLSVFGCVSDGGAGYGLTKTNIRTLDLKANNTYKGPTVSSATEGYLYLRGTNDTCFIHCNGANLYALGVCPSVTGSLLSAGTLAVGADASLGGGTVVVSNGVFANGGGNASLTLTNRFLFQTNRLRFNSGVGLHLTTPITLNGHTYLEQNAGYSMPAMTLSGDIGESAPGCHLAIWAGQNRVLSLKGDSSYSGGTSLTNGFLAIGHTNALGSGTFSLIGDKNVTATTKVFLLPLQDMTLPNALDIWDDFSVGTGGYQGKTLTFTNAIALRGPVTNYTIGVGYYNRLNLNNDIAMPDGPRSVRLTGGHGILSLTGSNDFSSVVFYSACHLSAGTYGLYVAGDHALGSGLLTIKAYNVHDRYQHIRADPGPATVANDIWIDDAFSVWDGYLWLILGGNGQALKLTGEVLGSTSNNATGRNKVEVKSGATLAVTGRIDARVTIEAGAALSAGDGCGALTINSNLSFTAGTSLFKVDLAGAVPGRKHDQITINNGVVTLNGATFTNSPVAGPIPPDSRIFILVNNGAAAIGGTFKGLLQDATVDLGMYGGKAASCRISYTGDEASGAVTGGNDIVLYAFQGTGSKGTMMLLR